MQSFSTKMKALKTRVFFSAADLLNILPVKALDFCTICTGSVAAS